MRKTNDNNTLLIGLALAAAAFAWARKVKNDKARAKAKQLAKKLEEANQVNQGMAAPVDEVLTTQIENDTVLFGWVS